MASVLQCGHQVLELGVGGGECQCLLTRNVIQDQVDGVEKTFYGTLGT